MAITTTDRQPTTVISEVQRDRYEADGYLGLEGFVSGDWLDRLKAAACTSTTSSARSAAS
ncbi:MAG: hypothetical protein ACFCVK_04125 [Acidimicrobiales bacterium]